MSESKYNEVAITELERLIKQLENDEIKAINTNLDFSMSGGGKFVLEFIEWED